MKQILPYKNIYYLISTKNRGFTLIELLVVAVIIGVLAAIATPSYLTQIGKARETEAKVNLGAIGHSQQAHHFESKSFYSGNINNMSSLSLSGQYYAFTSDNTADGSKAIHTAYATDPANSRARDYSIGVYYVAPQYSQTLCIATGVDNDGTASSVTAKTDTTCDGGNKIQ